MQKSVDRQDGIYELLTHMKFVTWNCNGALRKKLAEADALNADILVIQECEDPTHFDGKYREWAGDYLWIGTSKNKGIGVFPKHGNRVTSLPWDGTFSISGLSRLHSSTTWSTSDLKLFLPFRINDSITVLAVWTKGSDKEAFGYIGQLWKYLQIHAKDLSNKPAMLVGDLNSNTIWDKPDRWWSHSGVVAELHELGIHSLYHHVKQEQQGAESIPTFFLHRMLNKPYHIDYVFVSEEFMNSSFLEIGQPADWLHVSDHMPVSATLQTSGTLKT